MTPENDVPLLGHSGRVLREPFVGWESYDGFTREGTSTDVRALRIGRKRWRIELMKGGVYVRCGGWSFNAGFEWEDDR